MPVIYALSHVPPEVSAYGMAKYSRSKASMKDSLLDLSQQKAEAFLNTFYFSYGHASIADLAHVPLAIEQVSLFAAMEVVDEPLWDGQERSTRYQDFSKNPFYTPPEAGPHYDKAVESLFDLYRTLFSQAASHLGERYPNPQDLEPALYRRTIRARAFDVARYALPLAALTSLGQVTNARVLEQQIRRLMASPYAEVREIAAGMKAAVTDQKPFNLLEARLEHLGVPVPDTISNEMNPGPLAPTLTKYTDPDSYMIQIRKNIAPLIGDRFNGVSPATDPVVLHSLTDPVLDMLAGIIYQESSLSYHDIMRRLLEYSDAERLELIGDILHWRGPYDAWPRILQQRPLIADVLVDVGAFRDLNRHRRLDKVVQRLDPRLGYDTPLELDEMGVSAPYQSTLNQHYASLGAYSPDLVPYLLPLGHRRRVLLRLDFAEAAYLIELRSRSSGHFSYRRIAQALYRSIEKAYPALARAIRVTPLEVYDPFER